jgi:hypothetical protein
LGGVAMPSLAIYFMNRQINFISILLAKGDVGYEEADIPVNITGVSIRMW